jgi:hypothetical protein
VAASRGIAVSTVYNWIGRLAGVERQNAAAALVSANHGRTARVPCSDEAWQMLLALYLRLDKPPLTACFREVAAKGRELGWTIPSRSCLERRIQSDVPVPVRVLMREGREALAKLYPCQERDRSMFHALECVNADGHKWDDMVRWPDGYVGRPMMVAFQDLYSNLILSWRIDKSENKEAVRLAFGDMVETYGIPEHCWLDNGRSFASKWLTGGVQNRFRFKIKDEDPHGILPLLGTQVHWTKPFSGQSKPIERAFGEFAGNYAKHPRFAGAGTGNSPTNKPANYGDHVIPLDVFLEVVATCVAEHNSREGRKTRVCGGRLSFQQAFNASYATSIIRKATPEHRQLWLLAAEGVTARAKDGALHVMGNRYSAEELLAHRGTPMVVRFDPQMLLEDIHVYTLDGRFVCMAKLQGLARFDDASDAQESARAKGAWLKGKKMQAQALIRMSAAEAAAMTQLVDDAPLPETKIVRPLFGRGGAALARQQEVEADEEFSPAVQDLMDDYRRRHAGEKPRLAWDADDAD